MFDYVSRINYYSIKLQNINDVNKNLPFFAKSSAP